MVGFGGSSFFPFLFTKISRSYHVRKISLFPTCVKKRVRSSSVLGRGATCGATWRDNVEISFRFQQFTLNFSCTAFSIETGFSGTIFLLLRQRPRRRRRPLIEMNILSYKRCFNLGKTHTNAHRETGTNTHPHTHTHWPTTTYTNTGCLHDYIFVSTDFHRLFIR